MEVELTHLLLEVREQGLVLQADEVGTLVGLENGVLLLLLRLRRVLVEGAEKLVADDEVTVALGVVNLDVGELGVNAKSEVGGEGPGGGGPREEGGGGVVEKGKGDGDCGEGDVQHSSKREREEGNAPAGSCTSLYA